MSLTDRLVRAQQQRETGSLGDSQSNVATWQRRQTSPFTRTTGSLSLAGETEFETISRELGLTRAMLAFAIGMSELMLDRWQHGLVQPSGQTAARIAVLRQLHARLYGMFQSYQVLDWMRTANSELGYMTPLDALMSGSVHRVERALDALEDVRR